MVSGASDLAAAFRAHDDARLARLLTLRPDLARPVAPSVTAMANRAATRASAVRALATLTTPELTALEAIVILTGGRRATTVDALTQALGFDSAEAVQALLDRALLTSTDGALTPAPGVTEATGPAPLGLGPALREVGANLTDGWPVTGPALTSVMKDAPEGAIKLLDALTWGPPVGTLGTTVPPPAQWLLEHHILHRQSGTEVVLPREVALAARGPHLVRQVPLSAPTPACPGRTAATIAAEVVRSADQLLRQLTVLIDRWGREPRAVLRRGGVGARDIKALADDLGSDDARASFVCELAAMAGLLGQVYTDDASLWAPTRAADMWLERDAPHRWALLAGAWLTSTRVPWLAGTRSERGVRRAALDPDLTRAWAARLRRLCLTAIAAWPEGSAPTPAQIRAYLAWTTPRAVPPQAAIESVLSEASTLGLLGAGALSPPATALLQTGDHESVAAALTVIYPAPTADLIIQSDLTGIVPGHPTHELRSLLEAVAEVESRGAAMTVRFTRGSVTRALTHGWSARELLDTLRSASRSGVPQPLEYLIGDIARTHHTVRVQPAHAIIRSDDETDLLTLLADPRLAHLGLRQVGPTVLAADAPAAQVHDALRGGDLDPVLEDQSGQPLQVTGTRTSAVRPAKLEGPTIEGPVDVNAAVAAMRAGERRAEALLAGTEPTPGTAAGLDLLHAAAAHGSLVRIIVAGADGRTTERMVRPLSVDSGRLRAVDHDRETEVTIAAHRIVSIRPQ